MVIFLFLVSNLQLYKTNGLSSGKLWHSKDNPPYLDVFCLLENTWFLIAAQFYQAVGQMVSDGISRLGWFHFTSSIKFHFDVQCYCIWLPHPQADPRTQHILKLGLYIKNVFKQWIKSSSRLETSDRLEYQPLFLQLSFTLVTVEK